MPRRSLLTAVLVLTSTVYAHADSLVYDVTLTSFNGPPSGTGTLTVNIPPPPTATVNYLPLDVSGPSPYRIQNFSVTIFNTLYTFDPTYANSYVQFTDGALSSAFGELTAQNSGIALGFSSYINPVPPLLFEVYVDRFGAIDDGLVSATPAASTPTPEPSTLALLGTGLLSAVGALRRKPRSALQTHT